MGVQVYSVYCEIFGNWERGQSRESKCWSTSAQRRDVDERVPLLRLSSKYPRMRIKLGWRRRSTARTKRRAHLWSHTSRMEE